MTDFRFQFDSQKQKYSVVFSMKDDKFILIFILSSDAYTAAIQMEHSPLPARLGLAYHDIEIAPFEELIDANMFIFSMTYHNTYRAKEIPVVGCTAVKEYPEAHVEYFIYNQNGRDEEMVHFSTNATFVQFKFEQMKADSLNNNEDVVDSAPYDFRMAMALVLPQTDDRDYEHIDEEVINSFDYESYIEENI
jgi:hypothetical protein